MDSGDILVEGMTICSKGCIVGVAWRTMFEGFGGECLAYGGTVVYLVLFQIVLSL